MSLGNRLEGLRGLGRARIVVQELSIQGAQLMSRLGSFVAGFGLNLLIHLRGWTRCPE